MSRNTSTTTFQGFSVYQPSLGATLQWLPALGTQELDDLITSFLPGPASIQDKRAHISMDFFEYARQTGQNFKFYSVSNASFTSTTNSPASTTMYDSGYNSGMNTSPAVSDLGSSWTRSSAGFAGSSDHSKPHAVPKRPSNDFSGHPGMRIMTKDGRDVTNSASRGSKTKQQRDHAHLMRIIKACDSCKRKKTRCDPSHKKKSTAQAPPAQAETKTHKKTKKMTPALPVALPLLDPSQFVPEESFNPMDTDAPFSFESSCESLDDLWSKFVDLEESEPLFFSHDAQLPQEDYDFFVDPQGHFSPSSGSSSASPSQVFTPFTPFAANRASPTFATDTRDEGVQPWAHEPHLPYLDPDGSRGTNYVDFNLYSPVSDFLDEEPELVRKKSVSPSSRLGEASQNVPTSVQERGADRGHPDTSGDTMSSLSHSQRCAEDVLSPGHHQQLLPALSYSPSLGPSQNSQLVDFVESFVSCSQDSPTPRADTESDMGTDKDRLQRPESQSTTTNLQVTHSSFALRRCDSRTVPQLATGTTSALASATASQPVSDMGPESLGIIQRSPQYLESTVVSHGNHGMDPAVNSCQSSGDAGRQTAMQPDVTRRPYLISQALATHTRPKVRPEQSPSATSTTMKALQVVSSSSTAVTPTLEGSSSKSSSQLPPAVLETVVSISRASHYRQPHRSGGLLPSHPSESIMLDLARTDPVCEGTSVVVNYHWPTITLASRDISMMFSPALHFVMAMTYAIPRRPTPYCPGDGGHASKLSILNLVTVMGLAIAILVATAPFSTYPTPLTSQSDLFGIFMVTLSLVIHTVLRPQFVARLRHHRYSEHQILPPYPMPTTTGVFRQNLEAGICALTRLSRRMLVGRRRNNTKKAQKVTYAGFSRRSVW